MSKHDDVPRDAAGEMDPTTDESPEERRVRFYRALRDAGYDDLTIVRRGDVADEFNHRHFAIIDYLREESADSVRDLARELDFDKKDVSEDLQLLSRLEVVTLETDGRAKVPRLAKEHVFVEPLV